VRVGARHRVAQAENEPHLVAERVVNAMRDAGDAHVLRRRLADRLLAAISGAELPLVEDRFAAVEVAGKERQFLPLGNVDVRMLFEQPEQGRGAALLGSRNNEVRQHHTVTPPAPAPGADNRKLARYAPPPQREWHGSEPRCWSILAAARNPFRGMCRVECHERR